MLSSRCGKSVVLLNTQRYSYLSRTSQPSSTGEGGAHEAPLRAEELLLIGGLWVRVATVNHLCAEEWPHTTQMQVALAGYLVSLCDGRVRGHEDRRGMDWEG